MSFNKKELLENIKEIEITTREILSSLYTGERKSNRHGSGFEFDEFREYVPGEDDPKQIDWFASAKLPGRTLLRERLEEKQLAVFLVVDVSNSMLFGEESKRAKAFKLCAALAFSALKHNDKLGFISFSDRVEQFVYPRRGREQVLYILLDLLWREPSGEGTNLAAPWWKLDQMREESNLVFLISDFPNNDFYSELRKVTLYADLIPIVVRDSLEYSLPAGQIVKLQGLEGGTVKLNLTHDACQQFKNLMEEQKMQRERIFESLGLPCVEVRGSFEDYISSLVSLFAARRVGRF